MAIEIELKFRVPPDRLAALRRAVATASAEVQPLAAAYFDTPGEHLARARTALRLRREGQAWVQTLKAEGASSLQRLEDNVAVAGSARPVLDPGRHDGSPAAAVLRRLLAEAGPEQPLGERYATAVRRTRRVLRSGGARIELALDEGEVRAGDRSLALCEIEFELLSGPPQALLALAGRWAARHGLLLDVRSKSELGHTLAAGLPGSPPAMARPLHLARQAGWQEARAAMLANTLRQVLANASQLAAGPAQPGHLHQLRVGLRRLRSVLAVAWPAETTAALQTALSALFRQLGALRDQDSMADWLGPALQAAGSPWLPLAGAADGGPPAEADGGPPSAAAALLRQPAVQQLWLDLLALGLPATAGDAAADAATVPAGSQLAAPLQRLQRQVRRDARRFAALDDPARHRLRRRIKRLRYLVELSAGLWPGKPVRRLLRRLKAAQAPLGDFNDCLVAQAHCRALASQDAHAWFAVGWLAARREALLLPCAAALQRLARLPGAWPKA
ncbi:MAG: CYTH and CHAD domain-containing protein [Pseudomonadota bacterium]